MKHLRMSHLGVTAVLGVALVVESMSACANDRARFENRGGAFEDPSTASMDASACLLQCSLDGRDVIDSCAGKIETCRDGLACGGGKCMEPCAAAAADRSSNGCDFYLQQPASTDSSCFASFIVNTSAQSADVTLELEDKALDLSKAMFRTNPGSAELTPHTGAIEPGQSVILFISVQTPESASLDTVGCPNGVVPARFTAGPFSRSGIGSSYRLKSNAPIGVTTIYPFGGAPSHIPTATLILPVASWAKEHILINGWESAYGGGNPSAQIIASEDDTEITIVPKRNIEDADGMKGGRAGYRTSYRINKGQYLQLVQPAELTGSTVSSTKPTSIVGGNTCALVPSDHLYCDTLSQQIPAFEQWGSEYVGVGYRPRQGNEHEPLLYRIVGARDGTRLDYDPEIPPGAPTTLNASEVATFKNGTGDAFVVRTQDAEHPIYLAAYMTGGGTLDYYSEPGDPEFVNVVPAGQYLNSYSFYADPTYKETSLVVVRAKAHDDFKDVWLDCAGYLTDWKPVGTRGLYEYVRVDLQRGGGPGATFGTSVCQTGLQRMHSEGPFTATIWGWAFAASYAYPGGMAQRQLVKQPLDVH